MVKYSGLGEFWPYCGNRPNWLPTPFFFNEQKEIGREHILSGRKSIFSKLGIISRMVLVDSNTTCMVSPCSEFFALLLEMPKVNLFYWGGGGGVF